MKTNSTRLMLLAALLSTAAFAQAPNKVAYQGLLLKSDGTPETGMVSIKFSVYDAATGGSEVWTETQPAVVLTQGYYSTVLGEVTPFPANALDGTERFLEISVGGTALTPRMRVVSVPYAVRSNTATNVNGGTVNASSVSINGTTVIDGTGALAGNTAYTGANGITVTGRTIGLRSTCSAGEILRWDATASAWVCSPFAAPSSDGGVVSYSADPDGGLVLIGSNFTTFSLLRNCAAGQLLKWNGNSWQCGNDIDTDTTYAAAASQGLSTSGAGNTLFGLQLCPAGQILKSGGGTWACGTDTDTLYTATANKGLLLTGTGFAIDACPAGQVMKSAGGGNWACGADTDTLFDVIPAAGVRKAGNNFGLDQCPSGQVLKSGGSGVWGCQADNNSGGTVTQITAGNGLTGGTILTTGTIGLQTSVPNWTVAGAASCPAGTVLRIIDLDGTPTCQSITGGGTVTLITAGNGIITGPDAGITGVGAIAVAPTVQNWTVGQPNCPAGQAVQGITANGTTNCIVVSLDGGGGGGGSVTSVATGQGLTGGPITGSGTISIANAGVTNAMLANSSVTLNAGTGISITGSPLSLGGAATIAMSTPVSATNGGTGLAGPTLAGQFLRASAPGAWSVATLTTGDIPSLSGTYVDLGSSQTIAGQKTFSANIIGNLTGNATTATNGVVTTGSYNDPTWITGLAGSKVSGNISGTAAGFTGSLGGDVTGGQLTTVVAGIRGRPVDAVIVPAANNALMWSGTDWEPTAINLTNATTTGTLPIARGGTGITTSPAAGQYLRASAAGTWNVSGVLAGDVPNPAGDVTGTYGATVVSGIQGRPVAATAPVSGQLLGWNGATWLPASVSGTAPVTVTGANIALTLCAANEVYKMNAGGTAFTCQADVGGTSYGVQAGQGVQINGANNFGLISCANDRVLRYDTGTSTWTCSQITNAMILGPVSIVNGGTGAGTAPAARTNLGAAASGANSDITSLSGLTTPLSIGQGGTGSNTQNFVDLTTAQSVGGAKTFTTGPSVSDGQFVNMLGGGSGIRFNSTAASTTPMISMYAAGGSTGVRPVIAHSPAFNAWGLMYDDTADAFNFQQSNAAPVAYIDLGNPRMAVGTTTFVGGERFNVNGTTYLNGNTTVNGTVTATGFSGNVTGNVTGNVSGSAASFTGSLGGDVTGTQGSTVVGRLQGRNVANTAPGDGTILAFDTGTAQWAPTTVTAPLAHTGLALSLTTCGAGQVYQMSGGVWTCTTPNAGTVTSIGIGTGLTSTQSPLTTSGTISLASTVQNWTANQPSCPTGQVLRAIGTTGTQTCVPAFGGATGQLGYAWVPFCNTATCTPSGSYDYNSSGGSLSITRSSVGVYQITFNGLSASGPPYGVPVITGYGNNCRINSWGSAPMSVSLSCFNNAGTAVDSAYAIIVMI